MCIYSYSYQRKAGKHVHEDFTRVAIKATEGRKWMHLVVCSDSGVNTVDVSLEEARHMRRLKYRGADYPPRRAIKMFREFGRRHGITKGAKELLKQLESSLL